MRQGLPELRVSVKVFPPFLLALDVKEEEKEEEEEEEEGVSLFAWGGETNSPEWG